MAAIEFPYPHSVVSIDVVDGERVTVVSKLGKPGRFLGLIVWATLFQCGVGLAGVIPLAFALGAVPPIPVRQMGAWILLPLAMTFTGLAMAVFTAIAFAQTMYDRNFTFDLRSKTCRFENVPRFGCVVPLADIESIVLCSYYSKTGHHALLCLAVRCWKRYFCIHGIARPVFHFGVRDELLAELQPLAEVLSRLLDLPIEHRGRVSPLQLSWR